MRHQAIVEHSVISGMPKGIKVRFDARVFDYILNELQRHPGVEEGGKYIGFIDADSQQNEICELRIIDFLPGGPRATRTAIEFFPDGDFQDDLFQRAVQRDQAIEHLGTWHSHHCNGLREFSSGDIRGYFKTVNKVAYRPSFFLASLVKQIPTHPHDKHWIDHFLFIKGENDRFYKITKDIEIIDAPSQFTDLTGHVISHAVTENVDFWYQTKLGRSTLTEDQQFFRTVLGLTTTATRKAGAISIQGERGGKFIRITYPECPNDDLTKIEVGLAHPLLSMQCSLGNRLLGLEAGLHALSKLRANS
jgi:hypothetical protein